MLYILHAHDNSYKSTITAVYNYIISGSNVDLYVNIENHYKTTQYTNIYNFSQLPKDMYSILKGIDLTDTYELKSLKENYRKEMVEWIESQKKIFGEDVWAKDLLNHVDCNKSLWIGDLRFKVELDVIDKIKCNKHFIGVNLLNQANDFTYYEKEMLNIEYDSIITIDINDSYQDILNNIYNQLCRIVR